MIATIWQCKLSVELWRILEVGVSSPFSRSIQALRGIASSWVVLSHILVNAGGLSSDWLWVGFAKAMEPLAVAGVDLFFVISGAIMVMVTSRPKHSTAIGEAADFAFRRIFRVYPLYLLTLAVTATVFFRVQGAWAPEVGNLLGIATLIDGPGLAHPVAWTLIFEVRFYLVVALLLLIDRWHMEWLFMGWMALQTAAVLAALMGWIPTTFWTMPFMIEFVLGAAAGLLIVKGKQGGATLSLMVGAAWIVAGYSLVLLDGPSMAPYRAILFAAPCALLLYGIVTKERDGKLRVPKSMNTIGDASYSIYLWHYPILVLIVSSWTLKGTSSGSFLYTVTVLAVTAVVSGLSYYWFERPAVRAGQGAYRWLSRLCSQRQAASAVVSVEEDLTPSRKRSM
ncbi:acyltransferase [Azospirillum sp. YIM B02556]|uniref:Acyltransferase n=1 Tax=Azospirillum endophyticum TaxID=2800326 RepID=A0ABS1EXZ9_9PROT|nr:acyltransferase [Azospirillum endophyticum]MBK1836037.1 acyltransferase [Azospirillum endophyticum]